MEKRIQGAVQGLINTWTLNIDGDIPVKFTDKLALAMFCNSIHSLCKRYYIIGKKHQKKEYKQNATKRYIKNRKCNKCGKPVSENVILELCDKCLMKPNWSIIEELT